jgi:cysteine desulfuration protein SufE
MDFVQECMTPVYVIAERDASGMHFFFDVPAESPTVRGFAAIMAAGLDGAAPEQVLNLPNDFYQLMGLEQVLTMQRLNGISAILAHMKRIAVQSLQGDAG